MKKQIQILSIAITIILFSCGKHNAEISATITNGEKEFSANNSSQNIEFDLWLIDSEGHLRFNAGAGDHAKTLEMRAPGKSASYNIDRITVATLLVD